MPCTLDATLANDRIDCWGNIVRALTKVGATICLFLNEKGIVMICRNSSVTSTFQVVLSRNFFRTYTFKSNAQGWQSESQKYTIFDISSKSLGLALKRGVSAKQLKQFDIHVSDLEDNVLTMILTSLDNSVRRYSVPLLEPTGWQVLPSGYPSIAIQASQANTWFEISVATLKSYMDYMEPQAEVLEFQFRRSRDEPASLFLALEAYTESVLDKESSLIRLPIFTQARVSDARLLQTNVTQETMVKIRHREFRNLVLTASAMDFSCTLRGEVGYELESSPVHGPTYTLFSLDGESLPVGLEIRAAFKSEGGVHSNSRTPSFPTTVSRASTIIETHVPESVINSSIRPPSEPYIDTRPASRSDSLVTWRQGESGDRPPKRRLIDVAPPKASEAYTAEQLSEEDDDMLLSAFPTQMGPTQAPAKGLFD